jgi:phospholipid/cholesterol/gamma-HCH transport system ATP-binding protein
VPNLSPGASPAAADSPLPVVLSVKNLVKHWEHTPRPILNDVSFDVFQGDVFTIMGGSGCGKSTLLNILIGVDRPTSGSVHVLGEPIHDVSGTARNALMRKMGVLFQSGALLQSLTVAENIQLPLRHHFPLLNPAILESTTAMKLKTVGLAKHGSKFPRELSGGMKKRAGLARALALDPQLLFSDEPTSGLDPMGTKDVDDLTVKLCRKIRATAIVVTHDLLSYARISSRGIMLGAERDGDLRGTVLCYGDQQAFRDSTHPLVRSFLNP